MSGSNGDSKPIAVSAYAKLRGVSSAAVRKAIKAGRLRNSITYLGGKPKVIDVALANAEWDSNTQSTRGKVATLEQLGVPPVYVSQARREYARCQLLELELLERQGRLVDADEVGARWAAEVQSVKTKLLGAAVKARQRMPHLSIDDVAAFEALIREALEGLADA